MDFSSGKKDKTRKTYSIFASFILCCLGTSLMISALATQYWFSSGAKQTLGTAGTGTSDVHFGLFGGSYSLLAVSSVGYDTKIVCLDGDCMFSCGKTAALRELQLRAVRNETEENFDIKSCDNIYSKNLVTRSRVVRALQDPGKAVHVVPVEVAYPPVAGSADVDQDGEIRVKNQEDDDSVLEVDDVILLADSSSSKSTVTTASTITTTPVPHDDPEFMSYGLWVGTVSCLVIGMVFAVVGALFAVINTATTPVEFITGVPGLYIWNSMAAFFNLLCVILWAVEFHQHLTNNVLLYEADAGWTTHGMEVFGYSFWLVVVAIIVHVGNIVVIFVGTYERKVKELVEKPEEKSTNLMLY